MKKCIAVFVVVLMLVCSISVVSAFADDFQKGDVNCDSDVNIKDATLIQKHSASLTEFSDAELSLADVDANNTVNIKDATMVQKFVAGLVDSFPADTKPKETTATEDATDETEATSEVVTTEPQETTLSVDDDGYFNQIVRP